MKAGIIYNPSSGRARGEAIASSVGRGLTKRGLEVELHATQRPTDAMTIARGLVHHVDVVVAIGGDGTINEVVNGMTTGRSAARGAAKARAGAETGAAPHPGPAVTPATGAAHPVGAARAALGIVPAGTVNVLAKELELPFQVERACNVIAGGKTISLDVGKVNNRSFMLMTGAGIDALTVRNIDPKAKRIFREVAFLATGLRWGLAADPPAFVVRAGGQEYTATYFCASNCKYYAGSFFGLTPDADPTDGLLDLLIFTGTTRSSVAAFWFGVPSGLHLKSPNVIHVRAQKAELIPLSDKETVWFQTDGELAGMLPAKVKIDAHAIEVLVP